ncbi:helicase HerA-like domain-containing protein [Gephyromycinifex aptenodytis]|uniref:helicase HerA-like domain-containing protein n=1 Tax=Gephyromycinifex aptenodytis TaxID=2716227 RepID=UPI0014468D7F|nr:helicase HerA-like domain-containing protein [Gephyromycinifex aptenodytis]
MTTPQTQLDAIRTGYASAGPAIELGAAVSAGEAGALNAHPDVAVRLPLAMMNRHGLVAGATGTGKTKTLQLMAEQLSTNGVPVFVADVKGDLSGLGAPGVAGDRVTQRATDVGQQWQASAFPIEFYSLGGQGQGVPIRATITDFGPMLLSKVLGLNATQTSSLGLVFHYADKRGLPLLDLKDLRAVVQHLVSDEGKAELKELGGLSSSTAGVILRELIAFSDQGADVFFGEPEFDTSELLRVAGDGRGIISALELPAVQDRPALFSTFLMWLLADLFQDLPEVGDIDAPKLVFFFDEAHLLFDGASKEFVAQIEQTVRLIRSKGVGVFFVTQTPKDVPSGVLGQLGNRVQHALRAFTPEDATALKATVRTFPKSEYDLEELLTQLGTGEAVVTVLSERGAPTPVAWTRMRAPQSLMAPMEQAAVQQVVTASPLNARYATAVDRESAYEMLAGRLIAAEKPAAAPAPAPNPGGPTPIPIPTDREPGRAREPKAPREDPGIVEQAMENPMVRSMLRSAGTVIGREIGRSIFGTAKRRRR